MLSSQLQGSQCKQRKYQRRNPEAHDHLRLRPAQQFEVMVDGCHLENAFLAQLVRTNLQDYRQRLDDENTANERQQQFLFDHHGYGADRAAQRQRADIAHKHFRRMRVVPEKSNGGTDHGSAKNSELSDLRHALQFEVGCKSRVPAEVGEHRECSGRDHSAANGEPVKSVGKIDGVARCDNHKHNKTDKGQEGQRPEVGMNRPSLNHQVRVELFEEGHQQSGGVFSAVLQSDQCDRNQNAGRSLIAQFGARGKTEIAVMNDFKVVIGKTDCAEGHRGKYSDPYKRIAQVRPEQCRHQDSDGDQQIAQALNHDRPNDQACEKRGEAGESGAESQVAKNTEWRKVVEELQVEQPVEQSASNISSRFSVPSFTPVYPVYFCVPCGSGSRSLPQRTQRYAGETLKQPACNSSSQFSASAAGAGGTPSFCRHV